MPPKPEPDINPSVYEWTGRVMSVLEKGLGIDIRLHQNGTRLADGDIFVFNHFARFETFIPQYLIHRETGAYCRSIASSEFFAADDAFANFLRNVGGVPNDHPRLLPYLAEEILRGRKVIIFPEGGMVKDRRVMDARGRYSIYSRVARERRKQHTGAAILALALDAFKAAIRDIDAAGDEDRIARWAERLRLDDSEALRTAARRPTLIVPANITFYPIRVSENLLQKGAEMFAKGLGPRLAEELLIEGNILLKETDMDIRLGDPVDPADSWRRWERVLMGRLVRRSDRLDTVFDVQRHGHRLDERILAMVSRRKAGRVRDAYMREMYEGATVNLSHLASRLVLGYVDAGEETVDREEYHRALYLAARAVRREQTVPSHRGLADPIQTIRIIDGVSPGLDQFMASEACSELVERETGRYRFLPKLLQEHDIDDIRIENLISVYANEMAPITAARQAVDAARKTARDMPSADLARLMFEDEVESLAYDKAIFQRPDYAEINDQETATESAEPYLLTPAKGTDGSRLGILIVHGFLASPAELRDYAATLAAGGHTVLGVRLKGHGTSPWDLRDRQWEEWLESVRRGYRILSGLVDRITIVGFSSGGALSLLLAADVPPRLAGVAAVSTPLRFRNRNLIFVPLVHGANTLARWLPSLEGLMPFRLNESEHPEINYRNIPIRGLYELRQMVSTLENRLPDIECPVLVVQGRDDHVVDARSADLMMEGLGSDEKTLHMIEADRHGILNEDIGGTQQIVRDFIAALDTA